MATSPILHGDKPIKSESEDVLGFTSFADALAKSLTEMAPEDGLVISVEGEWGAGKTSAIELTQRRVIVRELARERETTIVDIEQLDWATVEAQWNECIESRRTHVIRFNPWNFSGQENLVKAFFREVGVVIGHPPDGPVARAIKKMTSYLPSAGTVIGGVTGAAAFGIPGAGAGGTTGRAVGESLQKVLDASESLETAKRDLADALRQSAKRIIVIIDDLDRLLPSEMRAMFSLVKSLGDLPNLLYVLSFDRKAVAEALTKGLESVDATFLEKIIQVPLRLPPPWEPEIRRLFFTRINAIIGDGGPSDVGRWRHAFLDGIAPYIGTPRDVTRFSNTFQVIWPCVLGDVDFTDLVILTVLQLFEESVYQQVFENIDLLAGDAVTFEDDKIFAARFDLTKATKPEVAKKAMAHLFPRLAKGWNSHTFDGTIYIKKREQRRICTREYYRNYFLFGRDPDRVSRAALEGALLDANPGRRLRALIKSISQMNSRKGASRVAPLLDQVFEIVFSKPLLTNKVVGAVLDLSDELAKRGDRVWEFFPTDNFERLDSILTFGLEPLSKDERKERVNLLSLHARGLSLAASVTDTLAQQHGLHGGAAKHESEQYIAKEIAEVAVANVLTRIRRTALGGDLLSAAMPSRLIWTWRRWTSAEELKSWFSFQLKLDKAILRLAEVLPSTSYQSGSEGQREVRSFRAKSYEEILDVDQFRARLNALANQAKRGSKARRIRAEFLKAETAGKNSRF